MVIPSFIAVSQLRAGVALYYLFTKTVIVLEHTGNCEKNMEEWHNKKYEKYHPLPLAMVSNGWPVHLFPIKIGPRGYCFTNVRSCFMWLGFSSNLVKASLKSLSLTSLRLHVKFGCVGNTKKWENLVIASQLLKTEAPQQSKNIWQS